MNSERYDVDPEILLPAGMELVVPPPARDPVDGGGGAADEGASAESSDAASARAVFPPFDRGESGRASA